MTRDEIERWFTYHPPIGDQAHRYELIRARAKDFANLIFDLTPLCPDQRRAIEKLREVVYLTNAAIACNE